MRSVSVAEHWAYWMRRIATEARSGNPCYVPRRIRYGIKKRLVDRYYATTEADHTEVSLNPGIPVEPTAFIEHFRNRKTPVFHFRAEDFARFDQTIHPEVAACTRRTADEIAEDRFTFRGFAPVQLRPVNWEHAAAGDPAWRRDLNRHFYFTQLGMAYWHTRDFRFARKFCELSGSWVTHCADRLGDTPWNDPFEVAARVNAWIWAYFLFLDCPEWDAADHRRFLLTLGRMSEYLCQTLEVHRPGNHVLLEAKALVLAAGLFPEFNRAGDWADRGWRVLRKEFRRQICTDGVHAERSSMYHRIIAGELCELLLFCLRNRLPVEDGLLRAVYDMADFERHITAGGAFPLLGDAYASDSYMRFSAPAVVAYLARQGTVADSVAGVTEATMWLLGSRLDHPLLATPAFSPGHVASKAFPDGGYFVSRWTGAENDSLLVWDCGPLGFQASPYHGHSDALSIFIAVDNVPLLLDPGADERDAAAREYLCGTSAHNTVTVDGRDQSERIANTRISRAAQARLIAWGSSPECDAMIGRHDGYLRRPYRVLHTRSIVSMRGAYWVIIDRLDGRGRHRIEQRFHFAPGAEVTPATDDGTFLIERSGVGLILVPVLLQSASGPAAQGKSRIENGFAELQYGHREAIPVVNTVCEASLPLAIAALVAPHSAGSGDTAFRQIDTSDCTFVQAVEVTGAGFRDSIFFSALHGAMYTLDARWVTDARLVILRYEDRTTPSRAIVVDCSTFRSDDREHVAPRDGAVMRVMELTHSSTTHPRE